MDLLGGLVTLRRALLDRGARLLIGIAPTKSLFSYSIFKMREYDLR